MSAIVVNRTEINRETRNKETYDLLKKPEYSNYNLATINGYIVLVKDTFLARIEALFFGLDFDQTKINEALKKAELLTAEADRKKAKLKEQYPESRKINVLAYFTAKSNRKKDSSPFRIIMQILRRMGFFCKS